MSDVLAACMRERDQLAETCRALRLEVAGKAERIGLLEGGLRKACDIATDCDWPDSEYSDQIASLRKLAGVQL